MQWQYSGYPVMENGEAVFTSGVVEIEMTSPPQLPIVKMGPTAEPNIIPRPLGMPYAKWRISSPASDDLKRFVRGKYWHRIDTMLLASHLRARGMGAPADTFDWFASQSV